jgi:hypothetical protein
VLAGKRADRPVTGVSPGKIHAFELMAMHEIGESRVGNTRHPQLEHPERRKMAQYLESAVGDSGRAHVEILELRELRQLENTAICERF